MTESIVEVIDPSETTTTQDPTEQVTIEVTDVENDVTEVVTLDTAVEVTEYDLETVEVADPNSVVEVDISEVGERGPKGDIGDKGPPGDPSTIPGPEGPAGPQGPPGSSTTQVVGNLAFVWEQNDPSDTWVIFHNLGFHPAVSVVDSGGTVVDGTVQYLDDNTVEVTFGAVFGGRAYLS